MHPRTCDTVILEVTTHRRMDTRELLDNLRESMSVACVQLSMVLSPTAGSLKSEKPEIVGPPRTARGGTEGPVQQTRTAASGWLYRSSKAMRTAARFLAGVCRALRVGTRFVHRTPRSATARPCSCCRASEGRGGPCETEGLVFRVVDGNASRVDGKLRRYDPERIAIGLSTDVFRAGRAFLSAVNASRVPGFECVAPPSDPTPVILELMAAVDDAGSAASEGTVRVRSPDSTDAQARASTLAADEAALRGYARRNLVALVDSGVSDAQRSTAIEALALRCSAAGLLLRRKR